MKKSLKHIVLFVVLGLLLVDVTYIAYRVGYRQRSVAAPRPTLLDGVVRLVTEEGRTYCSGSVVDDTTVITAGHCVIRQTFEGPALSAAPIEVRADDGVARNTFGKVNYFSPQLDQAVLKGNFSIYKKFKIIDNVAELTALRNRTTDLVACGYPMGGALHCSVLNYLYPDNFMWAVKGVLIPGMSGGPVFMPDGSQIAINDAVSGENSIVSPIYNIHQGF